MGDPSGIGPEVCLKVLDEPELLSICTPMVFGDVGVLSKVADSLGLRVPQRVIEFSDWDASTQIAQPSVLNLSNVEADIVAGEVSATGGRASYEYVTRAIDAAIAGQVDAITTGPINKSALRAAGISFPGHTEILASRTDAEHSCMMQFSDEVTAVFVTTHVGYREVPDLLTVDRILEVIQLGHDAIVRMRDRQPRMIVCGLNPHAGEDGLFGDEEQSVIIPAIKKAQELGIDVSGPLPPDTAFLPRQRKITDCFVCMYHDQGHIPLKALAFDVAVNVTLGLPIIRTSVDHGTAYDIAWQGKATTSSMAEAIRLAAKMARGRAETTNPTQR